MSNRDLLKEAIADAKAVKEMAISNAKAALEEAFTPQLKSMLEKKLTEMDEEEVEEAKMHDKKAKHEGADTMSEEELEEILAELEEGDEEDVHEEEEKEMHKEEEEPEADEEEKEEKEEEDFDLEEMSEEDLKAFIEDVVDEMIEAGELEAGEEEMEAPEMEASEEEVTDEEEVEEPMMEAEEEEKMEEAKKDHDEDEKKHMEEELAEAIKVIETLKAELNEVNLLNSKLLYTNKIFKAKNLSEAQKVKVLTTFDKAESVKEVKLVYETLLEGLVTVSTPKEAIKESKSFASKAVGTSPKKPVVETDGMVSRFQRLAGIK